VRREVGPVTPELADALADHMNIRRGEVHEVTSFYSFLQVPPDTVRVCTGPVCDSMGAAAGSGELAVACLGHCDLAPVRMEGDRVVGGVTHRANGFLLEADELRRPRASSSSTPTRASRARSRTAT
jgi:NADH:ubiquinone oxidoreductase subunit E